MTATVSMPDSTPDSTPDRSSRLPTHLPRWIRIVGSIAIALHLMAVVAEPFRFFTQTNRQFASADIGPIRGWLAPYVEFAFLNHGYFFFAPNPGPSHLLRCEIQTAGDRAEPIARTLPDKQRDFPRLYYHRHFMLSEFYNNVAVPSDLLEAVKDDDALRREVARDLSIYKGLQRSIINHLHQQYPDAEIELRRSEHSMPSIYEYFDEKMQLDDERLYLDLSETLADEALPGEVLPSTAGAVNETGGAATQNGLSSDESPKETASPNAPITFRRPQSEEAPKDEPADGLGDGP